MYVAVRFQTTTKLPINDIPGRAALPSIKLEHRDAPIAFYFSKNDIKMLNYKKENIRPTFFSFSASAANGKECGVFFGIGAGFIISNFRLQRDFNYFNK